jgi:hypothetical protein
MFGHRALTLLTSKTSANWRNMKWLIVKNAGDLSLFHVVNKSTALITRLKANMVDVSDMLAPLWNVWS